MLSDPGGQWSGPGHQGSGRLHSSRPGRVQRPLTVCQVSAHCGEHGKRHSCAQHVLLSCILTSDLAANSLGRRFGGPQSVCLDPKTNLRSHRMIKGIRKTLNYVFFFFLQLFSNVHSFFVKSRYFHIFQSSKNV